MSGDLTGLCLYMDLILVLENAYQFLNPYLDLIQLPETKFSLSTSSLIWPFYQKRNMCQHCQFKNNLKTLSNQQGLTKE